MKTAGGLEIPAPGPEAAVVEIAAVLAKGYLRLLARKAAPVAGREPQQPGDFGRNGLDVGADKSVHGDRLTGGAP